MKGVNYWHVAIAIAIGAFLMHIYRTKMTKPAGS